ncbi:hypothetical protein MtrunA17_Chr7g0276461 [Medicago truncatula]|uniref:Uncharacterized protein n=1 Tax=Medicago truncatula TaxID=3880 RepID=A0A396H8L4_MEDTR|nr:hypothetical protein MtrunA17_Chr7g0276461 [Medicago truncatula]
MHPELCRKRQKASVIWKDQHAIVTFHGAFSIALTIAGDNRCLLHRLRLASSSSCTTL